MAFWDRWLAGFGRKSGAITSSLDLFKEIYGSRASSSGMTVTVDTALQVTTVLDCVRVLAEGVAQVPLKLFQESADGRTRTPAKAHPLYALLSTKPNPWQTSFEFRESLMFHTTLCGDFIAFKNVVRGTVRELIPFLPNTVTVKRDTSTLELTYEVRAPNGSQQVFPASAIWHVRGPSWNTWSGMGAVHLARDAIGLAIAAEGNQSAYHKNGGQVSGLLSMEGNLSDQGHAQLRAWVEKNYVGPENAGKWMILDRGTKFTPMQMTGTDAQQLETRRHQVEEICRAFRVMPIMVGFTDKTATYASAEQMFIAHVVHTLSPWYQRLEQSINVNLLSEEDRAAGIYAKFNANGLMRGDFGSRTEGYAKALGSGGSPAWMEINEIRALEEMDAVTWGDGKPQSTNQTPSGSEDPPPEDPAPTE